MHNTSTDLSICQSIYNFFICLLLYKHTADNNWSVLCVKISQRMDHKKWLNLEKIFLHKLLS